MSSGATDAGGEAARLDELAEVTREYARYSRTAYGAGLVVTGAFALAMVAIDTYGGLVAARLAWACLPVVWLAALAAARAFYQRHGTVVEPAQQAVQRGFLLASVWFLSAAGTVAVLFQALHRSREADLPMAFLVAATVALFALVATPALATRVAVSGRDVALTLVVVLVGNPFTGLAASSWLPSPPAAGVDPQIDLAVGTVAVVRMLNLALAAAGGVAMVAFGARSHARFRRLERRLAGLKGGVA